MEKGWFDQFSEWGPERKRLCDLVLFEKIFFKSAQEFYAKLGLDFEVDGSNKNFLGHFCKYWNYDPQFEILENISLKKGLLVFGSNGTGKTTSFQIIQNMSKQYRKPELWFPIIGAQEVVAKYNAARNKDEVIAYYSKGTFFFDDLGTETVGNNVYQYGKEDIFVRILLNRYRNFESLGTKTHITTNLSFAQIENRYGKQISDRFIRMFNQLKLEGLSRRK
ncbi:DNA replication protein DnaC [Arenibacter nanhaiticus]|uniref:DNA replication protein DnaC n=1 Tax=Arenibacter nanhaiticus TaxID=558155 RepID=A0A1M6LWB0_9FLAO|nr:hypothetical protein [Arenibacter nanhaiticus]SHJ75478.1 DNA replication protein DnaC [Arenibacter nanhaiticus]